MPAVTPPSSVTSSSSTPAPATGSITPVSASIGNAPDKIQQLAQQIQVSGLIAAPPEGGEITLNTVIGNLTILLPQLAKDQQEKLIQQLTALFQSQKPLTVVVQPGNPPAQAILLLPPSSAPAPGTASAAAQTVVLPEITLPSSSPPLTQGAVLPAVVLPPAVTLASSANATPLPVIPTDDQIAILTDLRLLDELATKAEALLKEVIPQMQEKILPGIALTPEEPLPNALPVNASPPSATSQTVISSQAIAEETPLSPPANNPLPATAPAPPPNAALPPQAIPVALEALPQVPAALVPAAMPQAVVSPLAALLQPGAEVTLSVDAVALPSAVVPVPNLPNQIAATVTGTGPGGQLLVQSGDATFYIKQSVNVPVGSTLLLTVEPAAPQPLTPLPLPDAGNFGALQQALTALAQANPQLAQQVMQNVIPQPTEALGGALLLLLSAIGQGNLRGWLGNSAVDTLTRAGKMELIAKLTEQLREGGQTVQDPVVGAWRAFAIPLHAGNQFQTLHFYIHGDARGHGGKGDAPGKSGANAVRFLIDVRLSKLGAMQLDGFVRPKQLDMIIRSERALPEGLGENLRQAYIKTMEAVGYAGSLGFQMGRQGWMNLRKAGAGRVEV